MQIRTLQAYAYASILPIIMKIMNNRTLFHKMAFHYVLAIL